MKTMLRYLLVKTIIPCSFRGKLWVSLILENEEERARDQKEVQLHEQI